MNYFNSDDNHTTRPDSGYKQENLYYYYSTLDNILLSGLSPSELFFQIAIDQTMEQLGVKDVEAVIMILLGQPFVKTRKKFGGATKNTSVASIVSRKLIKYKLPEGRQLLMPTGTNLLKIKLSLTGNLGAWIGRSIPLFGWYILGSDVFIIITRTTVFYNTFVKEEDKIW